MERPIDDQRKTRKLGYLIALVLAIALTDGYLAKTHRGGKNENDSYQSVYNARNSRSFMPVGIS